MYKFSTLEKDKTSSLVVFPYGYVSRLVELSLDSLPTALLTTIAFRARISEDL